MILTQLISSRALYGFRWGPQRVHGVLLVLDISGFTPLSERLGRLGKRGTEDLTRVLNLTLGQMLEVVMVSGGEVLKFQGDGLMVGFYPRDGEGEEAVGRRALGCARRLMEAARRFARVETLAGPQRIRIRVVVARGSWQEAVIGDARRSELFVSGEAVERLLAMEDRAEGGTLWVDGTPVDPEDLPEGTDAAFPANGAGGVEDEAVLRRFLPQGVEDFLQMGVEGEHRLVSSLFVEIAGYRPDRPPREKLQKVFVRILDGVERHGGSLARLDPTLGGSRLLILFGAPQVREHSVVRAVRCARDLARLHGSPFPVRVAVATGFVYSGVVGHARIREFTVLGDAVNLAARLVKTAPPGEPVVDRWTFRLSREAVRYREIVSVRVQGKSRPVERWVPEGLVEERLRGGGVMVGRERSLRRVEALLGQRWGWGLVVGEAGVGKSRFLTEVAIRAREGWEVLWGEGQEKGYGLWGSLLMRAAEIQEYDPPGVKLQKLRKHLQAVGDDPALWRRLPFMAVMLLGVDMPGSVYHQVDARLRHTNLVEALARYLQLRVHRHPVLMVLDDVHLAPAEERELVRTVVERILDSREGRGLVVLMARRPVRIRGLRLSGAVPSLRLHLRPLGRRSTARMIRDMLGGPVEDNVVRVLYHRTQGNPFLLEQYVRYLLDRAMLRPTPSGWTWAGRFQGEGIPENVWAVVMARVDRLPVPARQGLRVGSVVGMEFSRTVVVRVAGSQAGQSLVHAQRARLLRSREEGWAFRHALIREVVYGALLEAEKRRHHRRVGEALEALYRDNLGPHARVLAHHFTRGEVWDRALRYALLAGDFARETYRIREALEAYRHALRILEHHFPENRETAYRIHEALGDTLHLTGDTAGALRHFRQMARIAGDDPVRRARALWYQAQVERDRAAFGRAASLLEEAEKILPLPPRHVEVALEWARILGSRAWLAHIQRRPSDAVAIGERAVAVLEAFGSPSREWKRVALHCHNTLCVASMLEGAYPRAVEHGNRALALARDLGDRLGEARVLGNLGLVFYDLGDWDQALVCHRENLAICEAIGYTRGSAAAWANLGLLHLVRGEYPQAREALGWALTLEEREGDTYRQAKICCNLGVVAFEMGDLNEARRYFERFLDLSRQVGYRMGEALATLNLGGVFLEQGALPEARRYLGRARTMLEALGDRYNLLDARLLQARIRMEEGALEEAEALTFQVLQEARAMGVASIEARALAQWGEVGVRLGRSPDTVRMRWERAVEKMRTLNMRRHLADALFAYGMWLKARGDPDHRGVLREARELYRTLGVPLPPGLSGTGSL